MSSRRFSLLFAVPLLALSCEITEPEPIQGNGPEYPPVQLAAMNGVPPGGTMTGIFRIGLPDSVDPATVNEFAVILDSTLLASRLLPGQYATIDLHQLPEGAHVVTLILFEKTPRQGMLELLGAPDRYMVFPFVVDHWDLLPPLPATNLQATWTDRIRLQWTPTTDEHFYAYVIRRHHPPAPGTFTIVDSIFDRTAFSYTDSAGGPPVYGATRFYSVLVTNRYLTAATPTATATYGTPFTVPGVSVLFERPSQSESIVLSNGNLVAISTTTHQVLRQAPVTSMYDNDRWLMTSDRSTLVQFGLGLIGDTSSHVVTYSATTLEPSGGWTPVFRLNRSLMSAPGPGTSVVTYAENGTLMLLNGLTGVVSDSIPGVIGVNAARVATSPDRNTLYVAKYESSGFQTRLKRYSINSGSLLFQNELLIDNSIVALVVDPSGSRLAAVYSSNTYDAVALMDPVTLATTAVVRPPASATVGSLAYGVVVTTSTVTLAFSDAILGDRVVTIDIASGAVLRSWLFVGLPYHLYVTPNGAYLYALGIVGTVVSPGWVITL
jgi:hypothetical protein